MPNSLKGIFLATGSAALSSIATIYYSSAIKTLSPIVAMTSNLLLGGIFLAGYIIFSESRRTLSLSNIKDNLKDLFSLTLFRYLIAGTIAAYGYSLTNPIKAMFFTKIEPYFVMFWLWILKGEKVKRSHLLLLLVHLFGGYLLSTGGTVRISETQLGDLLLIIAMAIYALSYKNAVSLSCKLGARNSNAISLLMGGIIMLPIALFFYFGSSDLAQFEFGSIEGWRNLIVSSLLFTVFGLTMWYMALKDVQPWMVSALRAFGPVIAAPFAWFFFGDTLSAMQISGGLLILATSFLIAMDHVRG